VLERVINSANTATLKSKTSSAFFEHGGCTVPGSDKGPAGRTWASADTEVGTVAGTEADIGVAGIEAVGTVHADTGEPAAAAVTAAVPLRQQGLAVEDTVADIADLQKADVAAAVVVETVLGQAVVVVDIEAFAADIEVHAVGTEVLVVVDIAVLVVDNEVPAADTEVAMLRSPA
jgi:hypothetical protein